MLHSCIASSKLYDFMESRKIGTICVRAYIHLKTVERATATCCSQYASRRITSCCCIYWLNSNICWLLSSWLQSNQLFQRTLSAIVNFGFCLVLLLFPIGNNIYTWVNDEALASWNNVAHVKSQQSNRRLLPYWKCAVQGV